MDEKKKEYGYKELIIFIICILVVLITCMLAFNNKTNTSNNLNQEEKINDDFRNEDTNKEEKVIFDIPKACYASKEELDNIFGTTGEAEELEPYCYNYGEGLSAIIDNNNRCINICIDTFNKKYDKSNLENLLIKYGINLNLYKCLHSNEYIYTYKNTNISPGEIDIFFDPNEYDISQIVFHSKDSKEFEDFCMEQYYTRESKNKNDDTLTTANYNLINYNSTTNECTLNKNIDKMSNDELRIARNEIYARHGYRFKDSRYKRYFEKQSWYNPTNDDSMEVDKTLTKNEKECVNLILDEEQKRGLTENFD